MITSSQRRAPDKMFASVMTATTTQTSSTCRSNILNQQKQYFPVIGTSLQMLLDNAQYSRKAVSARNRHTDQRTIAFQSYQRRLKPLRRSFCANIEAHLQTAKKTKSALTFYNLFKNQGLVPVGKRFACYKQNSSLWLSPAGHIVSEFSRHSSAPLVSI